MPALLISHLILNPSTVPWIKIRIQNIHMNSIATNMGQATIFSYLDYSNRLLTGSLHHPALDPTMHVCSAMSDSLQPMDYRQPSSSVHGIFQARILEQVAVSFSKGIFPTQGPNLIFWVSCIAGRFFITEPVGSTVILLQHEPYHITPLPKPSIGFPS